MKTIPPTTLAFALFVSLFFVVLNKPVFARVGLPSCAEVVASVISSKFDDLSGGTLHFEGFSDYKYIIKARVVKVKLLKTNPDLGGTTCDNFSKTYYPNAIVEIKIEVDEQERYTVLPGQQITVSVASSGYAGFTENGLQTPWWLWLQWALMVIFAFAAIWLIIIGLRLKVRKRK